MDRGAGEVLDILRLWRPTPLVRAIRLEQALGTPARIYFKDESGSPAVVSRAEMPLQGIALPGGLRDVGRLSQVRLGIAGAPVTDGKLGREQVSHPERAAFALRLQSVLAAQSIFADRGPRSPLLKDISG